MKTETINRTLEDQKEYVENLREQHGHIIDGIIDSINDYTRRNSTQGCLTHVWVGTGIPLTSTESWYIVKLTELRDQQFMVSGTPDNVTEHDAHKNGVAIGRFTPEEWETRTMDTVYDQIRYSVVYTTPEVYNNLVTLGKNTPK